MKYIAVLLCVVLLLGEALLLSTHRSTSAESACCLASSALWWGLLPPSHLYHEVPCMFDIKFCAKSFCLSVTLPHTQIFSCILSLRSNELGQMGYPDKDGHLKFSPFFVCFSPDGFSPVPTSLSTVPRSLLTPTLLDLHSTFTAVLVCLEKVRTRIDPRIYFWIIPRVAVCCLIFELHLKSVYLFLPSNMGFF